MNTDLAISLIVICSFFTGLLVFVLFKFKYNDLVTQNNELNDIIEDLNEQISEINGNYQSALNEVRVKNATIDELRTHVQNQSNNLNDTINAHNTQISTINVNLQSALTVVVEINTTINGLNTFVRCNNEIDELKTQLKDCRDKFQLLAQSIANNIGR